MTLSDETTPVPHDPEQAAAAVRYMADLASLEMHQAETRRKKSATARNQAIAALLTGRWGGPIGMGTLCIVGIIVVGVLSLMGADVSVAVELAEAMALFWHGCPET